jgi:hypothetical protein
MAKSNGGDGGADSWPGLLSELAKNFLILRDIFGYALPGAVFLSIGVLSRRFSLSDVEYFLRPYQVPAWLALILALGACYTIGHLMSQIAFFPKNKWGVPWSRKKTASKAAGEADHKQDDSELFVLREDHPVLLTEYDRQSVMTQLRGSTGAAMLVGFLVFYVFSTPSIGVMAGFSGVFLLLVFWFSARPHMDDLKANTLQAGRAARTEDPDRPAGVAAERKD